MARGSMERRLSCVGHTEDWHKGTWRGMISQLWCPYSNCSVHIPATVSIPDMVSGFFSPALFQSHCWQDEPFGPALALLYPGRIARTGHARSHSCPSDPRRMWIPQEDAEMPALRTMLLLPALSTALPALTRLSLPRDAAGSWRLQFLCDSS